LKDYIKNRISEAINEEDQITKGSIAIPFFGRLDKAKSCTISINPSDNEFHNKRKNKFVSFNNRFVNRNTLNIDDNQKLSKEESELVYKSCLEYFQNKPYKKWFNKYETFLKEFELSYYKGDVVHLDIVQWATSPTWDGLNRALQNKLINNDKGFLVKILNEKKFKFIFLNGLTTMNTVINNVPIVLTTDKTIVFDNIKRRIVFGTYQESIVIGWSVYLQSAGLPGYEKTSRFAKLIKDELI
jgi:hypothetical protein